jgi:hypothetical protein
MKTARHNKVIFALLITLFFLSLAGAAKTFVIGEQRTPVTIPADGATYVGADECQVCHQGIYANWSTTGHKYKLMTPDEALGIRPDLPMPEGYEKDDILYVIGGWGWKARYIDNQGYIITVTGEERNINGSNQYNIETGEWVDYHSGEVLEYDCQRCHTTGASYDSGTEGIPGIDGSWEFRGIQCEACHGPGSEHVAQKGVRGAAIVVDTNASLCGHCHRRGDDDDKIPASGGFVQHHEQYQDFLASGKMAALDCVVCHDPHNPVHTGATNQIEGKGIVTGCSDCHIEATAIYEDSLMGIVGVDCIDCHMPRTVKSAVNTSEYVADVRSHLFRINTSIDAEFTYLDPEDGKEYANPYITLEYACLSCHNDKNKAWAAATTPLVVDHNIEEDIKIPTAPSSEETPGFGVFAAVTALMLAHMFKKKQ